MLPPSSARLGLALWFSLALGAAVFPAQAAEPRFALPIACTVGKDCFVQNYMDEDPGPGRLDYACGPLSYDGHTGTDIRLPDYRAMERGVPVLAAADGVVLRTRDEMDDVNMNVVGREAVTSRGLGNAVVIEHPDGWQTAYGHMKRGSIAVKPGDRVTAGQQIGLVGLSGLTEFPHVHFEVRHRGALVDPFLGEGARPACPAGAAPRATAGALWAEPKTVPYVRTALLSSGLATEQPDPEKARQGAYERDALPADAPLLVVWFDLMGAVAGDEWSVRLLAADDGRVLFQHAAVQKDDKVVQFTFAGLKRPREGWPAAGVRSVVRVTRDGTVVAEMERSLAGR